MSKRPAALFLILAACFAFWMATAAVRDQYALESAQIVKENDEFSRLMRSRLSTKTVDQRLNELAYELRLQGIQFRILELRFEMLIDQVNGRPMPTDYPLGVSG